MLILGPIFNPQETLTSIRGAAVSISPTSVMDFMSMQQLTEGTIVTIRAAKVYLGRPMAARAAGNLVHGRRPVTTSISAIFQLAQWPRFSTPSWITTDSVNKVHCYHYKSTLIWKRLLEPILSQELHI